MAGQGIPVDEREFIAKYGLLPTDGEREYIQSELILVANEDIQQVWRDYWLKTNPISDDLLERLYHFWWLQRQKLAVKDGD